MKYISTGGSPEQVSFSRAVDLGLASDGGLYVPLEFPIFQVNDFAGMGLVKVANTLLMPFLQDDFSVAEIRALTEKAFNFPIPLKKLDAQTSVLELFHGPTAAFKDIAAQFLGEVMGKISHDEKTILVATSGDTGGAVAAAFHRRSGFRVVILFPNKGISPLQRQQLTIWGDNIISLAVEGTFDDCQRIVKTMLAHRDWADRFQLTSANSINIARLLPQVCYYAFSSLTWWKSKKKRASYVIPTGNMGNVIAAFWAKKMGFPIEKIVMATNANRVISDYFLTGHFESHPSIATLANAMDVGNPSNFERLKFLWPNLSALKLVAEAQSVSDEQIKKTISRIYKSYGEIICPHTATAFAVRENLPGDWIVVATAHPAKFKEVVEPILEIKIEGPACLEHIYQRKAQYQVIGPSELEVISLLEKMAGGR